MPEFHDVCDIFPSMTADELGKLRDDIKAHGLLEDIWLWEGRIIDGRNRYHACQAAGIEPRYRQWDGNGSLVDFVLSKNLHRRHLTHGQLGLIAEKAKPLYEREAARRQGHGQTAPGKPLPSIEGRRSKHATSAAAQVGKAVGVSEATVTRAHRVATQADPEVVQAVEAGEMSLHAAEKTLSDTKPKQALDGLKMPVPERLLEAFAVRKKLIKVKGLLTQIGNTLGELCQQKGGEYLDVAGAKADLKNVRHKISWAVPYTECPHCRGAPVATCEWCFGGGWISKASHQRLQETDKQWLLSRTNC